MDASTRRAEPEPGDEVSGRRHGEHPVEEAHEATPGASNGAVARAVRSVASPSSAIMRAVSPAGNAALARLAQQYGAAERHPPAVMRSPVPGPQAPGLGPLARGLGQTAQGLGQTAAPSQVDSFSMHVVPGGQAPGVARQLDADNVLYKGDKARVQVRFAEPAEGSVSLSSTVSGSGAEVESSGWLSAHVYEWMVVFTAVGPKKARFSAGGEEYRERFTIVADMQDFHAACTVAHTTLNERYTRATAQINRAATAFNQAYTEQAADLDDVSAAEKMVADLAWGALFAAAGGLAGGSLGGWLKKVQKRQFEKADWLIDTAKDTGKFLVRSIDRLRRGTGTPSTAGDSTAPATSDIGRPSGERKASGKDPLEFLTDLSADLADESRQLYGKLGQLIEAARKARDANSTAVFEDDPVAVVNSGTELERITAGLQTDKKVYVKQLWAAWLGAYAWQARHYPPGTWIAQDNIGRKVRKKIAKAARACGESADTWIDEFGLPSRLRAEEKGRTHAEPRRQILGY
jgi:hypothetical protein